MLTPNQIRWAASHDWFVRDCGDGSIVILERGVWNGHDFVNNEFHWRGTFRALRDWAGY